jgi:hypothetical protein
MVKGSRKGKKNLPSNSIPTSSSNSLKLTLPARHNIALNPPTCAEPVADPVIQPGPDPVTPASPVSQTPAVAEAFPHCNNEQVEQEVEILSVSHSVETVPAAKLMDNFFTLEDSQDKEEISPPPTQKPKQFKKGVLDQSKHELESLSVMLFDGRKQCLCLLWR